MDYMTRQRLKQEVDKRLREKLSGCDDPVITGKYAKPRGDNAICPSDTFVAMAEQYKQAKAQNGRRAPQWLIEEIRSQSGLERERGVTLTTMAEVMGIARQAMYSMIVGRHKKK